MDVVGVDDADVEHFIRLLNTLPHGENLDPLEARKRAHLFLRARKFDCIRAFELYKAYHYIRYTQKLEDIDPLEEGVRRELLSEKFSVLSHTSPTDPTILVFSVRRHWPPDSTDRDVLKGILYQLDAALLDEQTQTQGITVIYDMTDASYANFDSGLSLKLLNLVTGSYPARLQKVFIISAPLWFRTPYYIYRQFVKLKLRERIFAVDKSQLCHFLPASAIPIQLGGQLVHNHGDWLRTCLSRMQVNPSRIPPDYFQSDGAFGFMNGRIPAVRIRRRLRHSISSPSSPPLPSVHSRSSITDTSIPISMTSSVRLSRNSSAIGSGFQRCPSMRTTSGLQSGSSRPLPTRQVRAGVPRLQQRNNSSRADYGTFESGIKDGYLATDPNSPTRISVSDFLEKSRSLGFSLYEREFETLFKNAAVSGTVSRFQLHTNTSRNRYADVPCLDQSAVPLPHSAYIHANFVHGYSRPNAYILTQGPLESTIADFWQMIWSTRASTIVMLTKTVENLRPKCSQYWPTLSPSLPDTERSMHFAPFTVTNTQQLLEAGGLYQHSRLRLCKTTARIVRRRSSLTNSEFDSKDITAEFEDENSRIINHFLFLQWPDFDVPTNPTGFLTFMNAVNACTSEAVGSSFNSPPTVIHCSAGIGRTGTFTAIDIALAQAEAEHVVDVRGIVSRMRMQRACTVQMSKQYAFIHRSIFTRLT